MFFGVLVDVLYKTKLNKPINDICEEEHCHCEENIIKSSIIHTIKISIFILIMFPIEFIKGNIKEERSKKLIELSDKIQNETPCSKKFSVLL